MGAVKKTQAALRQLQQKVADKAGQAPADQQHPVVPVVDPSGTSGEDPWIDAKESGVILDCHQVHVRRLAAQGKLIYKRSGRRGHGWKLLKSSVIALAKKSA